jgi:uncharacterized ParB-like nuclease family protein
MSRPAHQQGVQVATKKPKPVLIPINEIASTGYPLEDYADMEKVQRMQAGIRDGQKIKPVRVSKLTPENRDLYGVTDPKKKYYLNNGHHRMAAQALEGVKKIRAVPFLHSKRI